MLILRLAAGGAMLMHGLQKIGTIGEGTPDQVVGFLGSMGIPAAVAWMVIVAESLGALSLLLGFLTRFCAAALCVVMLGAIFLVHFKNGFFAGGGGMEVPLLFLGLLVPLVIKGGGMWSVDSMISDCSKK